MAARSSAARSTQADELAAAAVEAAKEARARGRRLAGAQRALRDSAILARIAVGDDPREVAKDAGVTVRTVERVLEDARRTPTGLDSKPMELVEGLSRGFARAIADYETMAAAYGVDHPAVALGAKKAADETRMRLAVLMEKVGKLPSDLELFASEMQFREDMRWLTEQLLAVRDGNIDLEDAIELFRSRMEERQRARLTALPAVPSDAVA